MSKFIIRRALGLIPLLFGIVIISFVLMKAAPGGPAQQFQRNPRVTQTQIDEWLKRWCLSADASPAAAVKEFAGWFGIYNCNTESIFSEKGGLNFLPSSLGGGGNGIIHGDFGYSIDAGRPVLEMITERMPATLMLTSIALILWVSIAILLGVVAAIKRYSFFDQAVTFFSYVFYSLPIFWLGLMMIFLFAVTLRILPPQGIVTPRAWPPFNTDVYWAAFGRNPIGAIIDIGRHLILPVTVLVLANVAGDSRFVRASMLDALNQDFVRTARAKGLPNRTVVMKHAFRNAMLPVVTNVALEIPFLFSGAIVTETIFSWTGMGLLFIDGVGARDYFLLMGILLITSAIIVIFNLVADVVYAVVDPRIRYD
ncbi:MAG: ABC transporter permease [Chloroflexi bacterium]|nr:MAG: ABC transporter permease [Chloroflexota bacterium]